MHPHRPRRCALHCRQCGGPNGLAIGPDGALYCCNNGGGKYPPDHWMAVGPADDYDGGCIQRIDPQTGETRVLYTHVNGNKLSAPNDLVFDTAGGFYFTDLGKRYARTHDQWPTLRTARWFEDRQGRVPDPTAQRLRPVAGSRRPLRRRHRTRAALGVRRRVAGRREEQGWPSPQAADRRRPRGFQRSTVWRSRPRRRRRCHAARRLPHHHRPRRKGGAQVAMPNSSDRCLLRWPRPAPPT